MSNQVIQTSLRPSKTTVALFIIVLIILVLPALIGSIYNLWKTLDFYNHSQIKLAKIESITGIVIERGCADGPCVEDMATISFQNFNNRKQEFSEEVPNWLRPFFSNKVGDELKIAQDLRSGEAKIYNFWSFWLGPIFLFLMSIGFLVLDMLFLNHRKLGNFK